MLSPSRTTLENNEKIRPQPDRENAFARSSGGGNGPDVEPALFTVTGVAHVFIVLFVLLRIALSPAVPKPEKSETPRVALMSVSTPETAAFATGEDPNQPVEKQDFGADVAPPDASRHRAVRPIDTSKIDGARANDTASLGIEPAERARRTVRRERSQRVQLGSPTSALWIAPFSVKREQINAPGVQHASH